MITVLYSAIAIALKRQNRALTDSAHSLQRNSPRKRRQAIQMAVVIVVMFPICAIPETLLYFASQLEHSWPCVLLRPSVYFIVNFALCSSSVVNPIICLSFFKIFRRGLRNILCSCGRTRNNKVTKCEQITLKRLKNIPEQPWVTQKSRLAKKHSSAYAVFLELTSGWGNHWTNRSNGASSCNIIEKKR